MRVHVPPLWTLSESKGAREGGGVEREGSRGGHRAREAGGRRSRLGVCPLSYGGTSVGL